MPSLSTMNYCPYHYCECIHCCIFISAVVYFNLHIKLVRIFNYQQSAVWLMAENNHFRFCFSCKSKKVKAKTNCSRSRSETRITLVWNIKVSRKWDATFKLYWSTIVAGRTYTGGALCQNQEEINHGVVVVLPVGDQYRQQVLRPQQRVSRARRRSGIY